MTDLIRENPKQQIRQRRLDLSEFLFPSPLPLRILTVDSSQYLPRLRALCPHAAVTAYGDGNSLEQGSFDLVLAESIFADAKDPYDALMELSRLLTDTGTLLAAFPNVRYHAVLEELQRGEFPVRGRHLWAKAEVVRILDDTLFKEIVFAPGVQDEADAEEKAWAALGFDDYSRDLATEVWLVKASRSTAEVANLKSLYDKKTRAELARILHRIEYDVNRAENRRTLQAFCEAHQIFPDYLRDFIHSTCTHPERLMGSAEED